MHDRTMGAPLFNVAYERKSFTNVPEEQQIQIFSKQMLSKRLFLGQYQERRYVSALKSYRDVVRVADSETDLKRDLEVVKRRLNNFHSYMDNWIGITDPRVVGAPVGFCLWVQLKEIPFGAYWFQIREVQFTHGEICLRLKCIRTADESEPTHTEELNDLNISRETNVDDFQTKARHIESGLQHILSRLKCINYEELICQFFLTSKSLFTLQNAKEVLRFTIILLVATFSGFLHFLRYLGDFTIKLMREISVLIQVSTPIFLGIIEFCTKCVGGFYILIVTLWRGAPPRINFTNQNYRALPEGSAPLQRSYNAPLSHRKPY